MGSSDTIVTTNHNYNVMEDEQLIQLIQSGDKYAIDFLMEKYKELVNKKIGKYFMIGAEKEDIMQEGMIGLFKAIQSFDSSKQNSFKTFANLCIERQLITAIKTSNRQKHMPLNSYLSLSASAYNHDGDNEGDASVLEFLDSHTTEDPLEMITKKEYFEKVEDTIEKTLSDFEKQVLQRFVGGESYTSIAAKLNAPVKSVDNAIQRIRKKAIKNIMQEE